MYSIKKKHIPTINFEKQVERNQIYGSSTIQESENYSTTEEIDRSYKRNIRKNGLIPMNKQLPRCNNATYSCSPEYKVNYSLVLPRIPMKVNYDKELKYFRCKLKRKIPLVKPFRIKKHFINSSFY